MVAIQPAAAEMRLGEGKKKIERNYRAKI